MAPSLNDRILELESTWEITEVHFLLFRGEETAAKRVRPSSNTTLILVAELGSERESSGFPLCTTIYLFLFTSTFRV